MIYSQQLPHPVLAIQSAVGQLQGKEPDSKFSEYPDSGYPDLKMEMKGK